MSISRSLIAFVIAALIAVLWTVTARAQQPGPHHGGAAMHTATMPASMMASQRMMREAETMMTNAASLMRDMTAIHAGVNHEQHHAAMGSLQSMLDHMRQLHGNLNRMMHDPSHHQNHEAMKNFQEACQDLRRMASSFESMTKNMNKAMRGTQNAARK